MESRKCTVKHCNKKAVKQEFACEEHLGDVLNFDVCGVKIKGRYISDSSTQIKIKVIKNSEHPHRKGSIDEIHKDWLIN